MPALNNEILNYQKGEEIYLEDQLGNTIYLIKSGLVTLYKLKGDNFIELDTINQNEIFGYLPFLCSEQKRFTSAIATKDTTIINITKQFMKAYEEAPDLIKSSFSNTTKKLKRAYFELRKLQYFESIYYDDTKKRKLQTYHARDLMKLVTILQLSFQRENYVIPLETFENLVFSLLTSVTIKLDTVLNALEANEIISLNHKIDDYQLVNLIDKDKMDSFNNYLQKNYAKDPNRLLLNEAQLATIKEIVDFVNTDNTNMVNEYMKKMDLESKSTMERQLITDKLMESINRSIITFSKDTFSDENKNQLVLESIAERGVIRKAFDATGKMAFSVLKKDILDINCFQNIITMVEKTKN